MLFNVTEFLNSITEIFFLQKTAKLCITFPIVDITLLYLVITLYLVEISDKLEVYNKIKQTLAKFNSFLTNIGFS